jgi:hypothetical protein
LRSQTAETYVIRDIGFPPAFVQPAGFTAHPLTAHAATLIDGDQPAPLARHPAAKMPQYLDGATKIQNVVIARALARAHGVTP